MIPACSQNTHAPGRTLLARCLARDPRAWTELSLALDPVIVRCLVRRLGPERHYALEDLRSGVLAALVARDMLALRVFRARPLQELRAHVRRVARNRAARYLAPRPLPRVAAPACTFDTRAATAGGEVLHPASGEARAFRIERLGGARGGLAAPFRTSRHAGVDVSQGAGVSPATIKRTPGAWRAAAAEWGEP